MNTAHEQIVGVFPKLRVLPYKVTSPFTPEYNCIAWAAGDTEHFWWPLAGHWPAGVPREHSVEAFVQAYATVGFTPCADGLLEPGFEKAAIYVDESGRPTHAAKQLSSGKWSSKLGKAWDIEHTLAGLEGPTELVKGRAYGVVKLYLKRPTR